MARRSAESDVEPIRIAEHDKLGPLGGNRSLHDDGRAARGADRRVSGRGDAAAKQPAPCDRQARRPPSTTSRKALRRARAMLALVSSALPKSERQRGHACAARGAPCARRRARSRGRARDARAAAAGRRSNARPPSASLDNAGQAMPPTAEIEQLLAEQRGARGRAGRGARGRPAARRSRWRVSSAGSARSTPRPATRVAAAKRSKRGSTRGAAAARSSSTSSSCSRATPARGSPRDPREIDGITDTLGPRST